MRTALLATLLFLAYQVFPQTYNYYFGNLHSHTGFSDGNQDSLSSGISRPDQAYAFAKASQHFDFLGISEHNHYSSANNPGFRIQSYQIGLDMADAANQDGTFLALFGMEYGVTSTYNGHVVVYGFNQLLGWEPGNYDIYNGKTDYASLFQKVKNNPNGFCYLAHPNLTDYTSNNNNPSTALIYAPYNAMYDSAIVGVPLRNGPAYSTNKHYSDFSNTDYFTYYIKMLTAGYHVGLGYDHDNHNTTYGRTSAGRLVILAPSLTRPNLYAAMQQMHFYGSDDWNAKIDFNMAGSIMGSVLSGTADPTFNVIHNDLDGEQANTISIWRGSNDGNHVQPLPSYSVTGNNTATFADTGLQPGVEYYYFAQIVQADGDWVITSPIWYTKTAGSVSIKENTIDFEFNYFPNPVAQHLSITMSKVNDYTINISDVSGRLVLQKMLVAQKDASIDLSALTPGIYTMTLRSNGGTVSKKLVVE